jgi:hypothetical protein
MANHELRPWTKPIHVPAASWALAVPLVILFVVCVLAAVLFPNLPLAHGWAGVFSTAPMGSARNLVEGIVGSLLFGWVTAAVFGLLYNLMVAK